jgi:hypothetical protein
MENIAQKAEFLKTDFVNLLSALDPATERRWGKMNVQQMTEHMADYVRIANGRSVLDIVTPADVLPKMQDFLKSEKPFRENTPNSLMSESPEPVRHATYAAAVDELASEIAYFFEIYGSDHEKSFPNPFFGMLNYEMQVQLLYKHATHHLRQFGIMAEAAI